MGQSLHPGRKTDEFYCTQFLNSKSNKINGSHNNTVRIVFQPNYYYPLRYIYGVAYKHGLLVISSHEHTHSCFSCKEHRESKSNCSFEKALLLCFRGQKSMEHVSLCRPLPFNGAGRWLHCICRHCATHDVQR